jgi:lysophospholipase L1-like esterase
LASGFLLSRPLTSFGDETGEANGMRLLVIGDSDTSGVTLANPSDAWPIRVGALLSPLIGQPLEVANLSLVPVGPKAVPRVEAALEKHQPDLVVFTFGSYHFGVSTVGNRVRRRYGARAYRLFRRLEVRFESKTASRSGRKAGANRTGRWLARRIIGAEPLSTKDEVTGIQLEIMRILSQREHLTVVIMVAPPVEDSLSRDNNNANAVLEEHRERMNAAGRALHFIIADPVHAFAEARANAPTHHSDGVHRGPEGHRIQTEVIMKAFLEAPSPLSEYSVGQVELSPTE